MRLAEVGRSATLTKPAVTRTFAILVGVVTSAGSRTVSVTRIRMRGGVGTLVISAT